MSKPASNPIDRAVIRPDAEAGGRLLDRAFALAFRGLVYAQIWEDPVVDMRALAIEPDSRVITIASGGCNVLSYLVDDPAQIVAIDLNTAHVALNRLKLAAVLHLPDYGHFRRFFGEAENAENIVAYQRHIAPNLDDTTRRYWEGRDLSGRRRIGGFAHGIYKRGLLGKFIGLAHLVARLHDLDPAMILEARSLEEQRRVFDEKFSPLFDRRLVRWLASRPASLFGLGIPPAQFEALAGGNHMADVLRARLEKLACGFPLNDNYFAWQAFSRGYGRTAEQSLPPYLEEANFAALQERVGGVDVRHADFTGFLATEPDMSCDRYVLLDAQDWMSDEQLAALWTQITRTARPGARVLFRTAAEPSLLPGRVPDALLRQWDYAAEESQTFTADDRSSIYGGVHLYRFRG